MLLFIPCAAQKKIKRVVKNSAISNIQKSQKINRDKPSVYVTFENYDKNTWERTGETYNIVWLRLHNNFKGDISFCYYDVSVSATGKTGVFWEVEKKPDNTDLSSRNNEDVPTGFRRFDFCNTYKLKSGSSFLFGVIEGHLSKENRIKIQFFYPWEDAYESITGREPQHYVYYYGNELPLKK